jgi:putative mRNA 3-end processing factor
MDINFNRGIVVSKGNKKIILDAETPKTPIGIPTIISHAHSDHTAGLSGGSNSYCTPVTKELYEKALNKKSVNTQVIEFYEPFEVNGFEIEFIPAGHLLGAAQIAIRNGSQTVHYTGDFCPDQLLCVESAKLPKDEIDVLIIETTYGKPNLYFEDRSQVRMKILNHTFQVVSTGKIPVFNVAHIGGAQEIIQLFNKLSSLKVYVDEKIHLASLVYNNYLNKESKLNYNLFDPELPSENYANCVVLLSRTQKDLPGNFIRTNIVWSMISGLAARFGFKKFDFTAALSSHANYYELLNFVINCKPKSVVTHYNYANEFADTIQNQLKIQANPLEFYKNNSLSINEIIKNSKENLPIIGTSQYHCLDEFF